MAVRKDRPPPRSRSVARRLRPIYAQLVRRPRRRLVLALALAALLSAGAFGWTVLLAGPEGIAPQPPEVHVLDAPPGPLQAGAAKVDITPESETYLAGFGQGRTSAGVHDPLYARALVIETAAGERMAIVALDVVGLFLADVRRIRAAATSPRLLPERILIATTHNHQGPDTLGFWGEAFIVSGRSEEYMRRLFDGAARAIALASRSLRPARVRIAAAAVPPGIAINIRDFAEGACVSEAGRPTRIASDGHDPLSRAAAFEDRETGATIATLAVFGMHAEALWSKNRLITADWPAYFCDRLESRRGGIAIFLEGALGGMVTVDFRPGEKGTFAAAERAGVGVAEPLAAALARAPSDDAPPLAFLRMRALIPCRNRLLNLFWRLGKIEREASGGHLETEVSLLRVGDLVLAGVPGEILPRPAAAIGRAIEEAARRAGARPPVAGVIALADDELGYLIPSEQWPDPRFRYERGWSPSSDAADIVVAGARVLAERLFLR